MDLTAREYFDAIREAARRSTPPTLTPVVLQEIVEFSEDYATFYTGQRSSETDYWLGRLGRILGHIRGEDLLLQTASHPENA